MQMLLDTQNYSPSAIEEISLFTKMDIDIQKSISMWFFFPDRNSVAINSFLKNNKNAITAYFSMGKIKNWIFF